MVGRIERLHGVLIALLGAFGGGQLIGNGGQILSEIVVKFGGETGSLCDFSLEPSSVDGVEGGEYGEECCDGQRRS